MGCEDVEWLLAARNGEQWLALVNMVMNFWVA
jgi:hypothetical protein